MVVYRGGEPDQANLLEMQDFTSLHEGPVARMVRLEKNYYIEHFAKGVKLQESLFDIISFWTIQLSRGITVHGFLHNPANVLASARPGVSTDSALHIAFEGKQEVHHDFGQSR